MTKSVSILMGFMKNTPGTAVYQEINPDGTPKDVPSGAIIPTLYIRKTAPLLKDNTPSKIKVDVTVIG